MGRATTPRRGWRSGGLRLCGGLRLSGQQGSGDGSATPHVSVLRRTAAAVAARKAVEAEAAVEAAWAALMSAAWQTRVGHQQRRQLGQKATGDVHIVPIALEAQVVGQMGGGSREQQRG
jgi:hypothetical protein